MEFAGPRFWMTGYDPTALRGGVSLAASNAGDLKSPEPTLIRVRLPAPAP